MTREEAIKVCIRERAYVQSELDACSVNGGYVSPDGIITAADYVEAMTMAIAALREQPQWVSVEERLPEKSGSYLTSCEFSGYTRLNILDWDGCYNGIEEELHGRALWYDHDSEWGDYELGCVTHWMPLPVPPEEEV